MRVLVEGVEFRAKPSSEYSLLRPDGSPMDELEVQFVVLKHDLRKAAHFLRVAPETFHPQSLIHDTDRDPVDVVHLRLARDRLRGDRIHAFRPEGVGYFVQRSPGGESLRAAYDKGAASQRSRQRAHFLAPPPAEHDLARSDEIVANRRAGAHGNHPLRDGNRPSH